jgi:hypothetical protein
MVKKSSGWNLAEMQESLVKDTEQRIEQGFEAIKKGEGKDTSGTGTTVTSQATSQMEPVPAVSAAASVPAQATVVRTARMFHKERTQDVLVHCPVSLHKRLKDLKDHIWDEYGERVNINNMVIEAIALWLDQQEGKKVSATT